MTSGAARVEIPDRLEWLRATPAGAPFTPIAEEAAVWAEHLPADWERAGRPFERALLDAALDLLRLLAPSQGEQVLVHQDLHSDNVLAAEREPRLVIDPKPLTGERELSLAPIIRSFELGHLRLRAGAIGRHRRPRELGRLRGLRQGRQGGQRRQRGRLRGGRRSRW